MSSANDASEHRALVLTAADKTFARTLWQLLRSAERQRSNLGVDWVAYDLGLIDKQRAAFERRFPWCRFQTFDFSRYPAHVRLEGKTFAWKPVLVHEASRGRHGPVLWLDSATVLRAPLKTALEIIERAGVLSLSARTPLGYRTDPRTLALLRFPLELWDAPERLGGVFGFDTRHAVAREVVLRWLEAAMDEAVIAPTCPKREHRYDQSILGCLLVMEEAAGRLAAEPRLYADISRPRPVRWLSTRNKLDPRVPTWADPIARGWYATSKAVDQAFYRYGEWSSRWPDGLRRIFKENFTVYLAETRTGRTRSVQGPRLGYYANPFVRDAGDCRWLFVEEYVAALGKGRLVAMEVRPDLSTGPPMVILDAPTHRSFPFVFDIDGVLHMIPESADDRTVDLWRCEAMPGAWRLVRRLFWDVDMVDTIAFKREGRWWIVGSVAHGLGRRRLSVHLCTDLLSGVLIPHPISNDSLDGDQPHGTGRNAGPVIEHGDRLLRVVQNSRDHYGQGSAIREIVTLSETRWRETPFRGEHPILDVVRSHSPHHVSTHGSLMAWDVRDRVRRWP